MQNSIHSAYYAFSECYVESVEVSRGSVTKLTSRSRLTLSTGPWLLCQLRNCPSVECCKSDSCKLIYCHDANLMYCLDELMGGTIAQYVRFLDDFAQHFLAIPYNVKSPDFAHPDGKLFNKFPFGTQRSSRKLC